VYLHEDAAMAHRDLKPSNILLTSKRVVKLCDFVISESDGGDNNVGHGGAEVVGTPQYMAPECFAEQPLRSAGKSTDSYLDILRSVLAACAWSPRSRPGDGKTFSFGVEPWTCTRSAAFCGKYFQEEMFG